MNPVLIMKSVKLFAILGIVTFILMQVNDFRKDQQAKTDALITANATAVSAKARAQTLAAANAQLEAISAAQAEAMRLSAIAMEESAERFREIEKNQAEQKALLEGNRLNKAIRGKRQLVENLANKATRERFDEVEQIFDGS